MLVVIAVQDSDRGFVQYPVLVCVRTFFLFREKEGFVYLPLRFNISIFALTRLSYVGQKLFKNIFLSWDKALSRNMSFWAKFLSLYTTKYLVRIWTYKNAEEKCILFFKQKQKSKPTPTKIKK